MTGKSIRMIVGSSVVDVNDLHLGEVTDALVDFSEQRVMAFVVDWVMERRQVFGSSENLPFMQVAEIDRDWLVVAGEVGETAGLDLIPMSEGANLSALESLLDKTVYDPEGNQLGTICDFYFAEEDGAIEGYEVVPLEASPHSWILPPSAELDIIAEGVRISHRDKEAMIAGRTHITTWEDTQQEAEETFAAAYPERRTLHPEPYDIPGQQIIVMPPQLNEEGLFDEENPT